MLEELRAIRALIDTGIAAIERLRPLVKAWRGDAAAAGDAGAPAADVAPGPDSTGEVVRARPSAPRPGNSGIPAATVPCAVCGAPVEQVRRGGKMQRYCSRRCRDKAASARRRAVRHENGRGAALQPEPESAPASSSAPTSASSSASASVASDRTSAALADIGKLPAATSSFGSPPSKASLPAVPYEPEKAAPAGPGRASGGPRHLAPDEEPVRPCLRDRAWSKPRIEPAHWGLAGRPQQAPSAALRAEVEAHGGR